MAPAPVKVGPEDATEPESSDQAGEATHFEACEIGQVAARLIRHWFQNGGWVSRSGAEHILNQKAPNSAGEASRGARARRALQGLGLFGLRGSKLTSHHERLVTPFEAIVQPSGELQWGSLLPGPQR